MKKLERAQPYPCLGIYLIMDRIKFVYFLQELFHFTQKLKDLRLTNTGLTALPELHLTGLLNLELGSNNLADLDCGALESLTELRSLNLERNKLTNLPSHCWRLVPRLISLDISNNPVRVLTKESFQGMRERENKLYKLLDFYKFFKKQINSVKL